MGDFKVKKYDKCIPTFVGIKTDSILVRILCNDLFFLFIVTVYSCNSLFFYLL